MNEGRKVKKKSPYKNPRTIFPLVKSIVCTLVFLLRCSFFFFSSLFFLPAWFCAEFYEMIISFLFFYFYIKLQIHRRQYNL